jgi:hypothetical protein
MRSARDLLPPALAGLVPKILAAVRKLSDPPGTSSSSKAGRPPLKRIEPRKLAPRVRAPSPPS